MEDRRSMSTKAAPVRMTLLEKKLEEKVKPLALDAVDEEIKTALNDKYVPLLSYPPDVLLCLARSRPVFHGAHALLSLTALGLGSSEELAASSDGRVSVVGAGNATVGQEAVDPADVDPGLSERQVMICFYMAASLSENLYVKGQIEQLLSTVTETEQLEKMGMDKRLFWKEVEEFQESTVIGEHEKLLLSLCCSVFHGDMDAKTANRCAEELTERVQAQVLHITATVSFFAAVSSILGLTRELPSVSGRRASAGKDAEWDPQAAVDGNLAKALAFGWREALKPLHDAGKRAMDFHKSSPAPAAKVIPAAGKTSAEAAASYEQRLNPANQIRSTFGFVPNCLLSMYAAPELLHASLRLYKCIFNEAHALPETLKLTVAVECARGVHNEYLESILLYVAHNAGVPISQIQKDTFSSKSATIQATFDLARSYGQQLDQPLLKTPADIKKTRVAMKSAMSQIRKFLTAEQITELVTCLGFVSYLHRTTVYNQPLPEPSVVIFRNSLSGTQ